MSKIEIGSVIRVTHHQEGDGPRLDYTRTWEGEVVKEWSQYVTLRKNGIDCNVRVEAGRDRLPDVTVEVLSSPPPVPGYYLVKVSINSAAVVRYWDGDVWFYAPPAVNLAVAGHRLNYYIIVERIEQS